MIALGLYIVCISRVALKIFGLETVKDIVVVENTVQALRLSNHYKFISSWGHPVSDNEQKSDIYIFTTKNQRFTL